MENIKANELQRLIDNLNLSSPSEEQKKYRQDYDDNVTEAQELLNNPEPKEKSRIKKWDHIAIRPETFERFKASKEKQGGMKSDDAFVILLLNEHDSVSEQNS